MTVGQHNLLENKEDRWLAGAGVSVIGFLLPRLEAPRSKERAVMGVDGKVGRACVKSRVTSAFSSKI